MFYHNFCKCEPTYYNSFTRTFLRMCAMYSEKESHLIWGALLHYLVNAEDIMLATFDCIHSTNRLLPYSSFMTLWCQL